MTTLRTLLLLVILLGLVPVVGASAGQVASVCFEPGGACEDVIVHEITGARRQVLVQAFSFTSRPIGSALVAAWRRGVDVRLIVDGEQYAQHGAEAQWCARQGVTVAIDAPPGRYAHAHDKVMIIDGTRVITGSYNPTAHASDVNVENLVVLDGADVASQYVKHFSERARVSQPIAPTDRVQTSR
ncbi:phospholipase D-like domain-containing protein [Nitrospirillum amazonense]|uniref:phospholipase D-like domain-containing protein n=1 Tax=Nitrospirillum amazonense TaxID=28077 RepID=UPI00241286E6|nr:phospholipase D-like domain-containing protein [Nitrospirillum amazonense]MDG3444617.1 phospholipase D-like domain-containing protein [Nitrospirillum amazonense]